MLWPPRWAVGGALPTTAALFPSRVGTPSQAWGSDRADTQGGRVWVSTRIQVLPRPAQRFAAGPHCHLGTQSVSNLPQPSRPWAAAKGWAIWRPLTSGWTRAPVHGVAVTCVHRIMQNSHQLLTHCPAGEDANKVSHLEKQLGGFPWWSRVKNLPANAGDMGSIPNLGTKIPHIVGQLSPWATTTETCRPRAGALQKEKPPQWEACTPRLEKAQAQQWRASTAKNRMLF